MPRQAGAPAGRSQPAVVTADEYDLRPPRGRTAPVLLPDLTPEVRDCLKSQLPNLKGTVLERSFGSQALGRVMRYVIYLPPGYNASGPGFPVLYMLHGRGGERTEWLSAGLLESIDRGIAAGKTTPMIVVVPEGQTGYWTDHAGSGPRWGEYIVSELTTHVDATYATRRRPSSRAIGGESMGGWGALHHGLSHPEVFGVVGAHSPSLRPDDGSLDFLGRGSEFAAKDPMALAARLRPSAAPRIWVDSGVDDPWAARAAMLDKILTERSVAHTWHLNPGGHTWTYWHAHLAEYIDFYSRSFQEAASVS